MSNLAVRPMRLPRKMAAVGAVTTILNQAKMAENVLDLTAQQGRGLPKKVNASNVAITLSHHKMEELALCLGASIKKSS